MGDEDPCCDDERQCKKVDKGDGDVAAWVCGGRDGEVEEELGEVGGEGEDELGGGG